VKYVGDERGGARGGTAAADLAVARDVGARREITVTFVAQNLGRDLTVVDVHTPLPRRLSLGAGTARLLPVGPFDVGLEGDVSLLRDGSVAPAAGGEASYEWLDGYVLAARAGVRRADVVQGEVGHATGTVGGSVTADRVSLDYGFAREAGVGVHRFGIRLR
jgi:hypothetical protein